MLIKSLKLGFSYLRRTQPQWGYTIAVVLAISVVGWIPLFVLAFLEHYHRSNLAEAAKQIELQKKRDYEHWQRTRVKRYNYWTGEYDD